MKQVVLIADHERRSYSQLRHRLIAQNCDVRHATSIDSALPELDGGKVDLLLVDLDVSGARILGFLSQLARSSPGLRIIGATEGSSGAHLNLREHVDGVAEKPFALSPLMSFIDELLKNHPPRKPFRYLGRIEPGAPGAASHRPPPLTHFPPARIGE